MPLAVITVRSARFHFPRFPNRVYPRPSRPRLLWAELQEDHDPSPRHLVNHDRQRPPRVTRPR
jgi:hypothetical protein